MCVSTYSVSQINDRVLDNKRQEIKSCVFALTDK